MKKINVLLVSDDQNFNSIIKDDELDPEIKVVIINSFGIVLDFLKLFKTDVVILTNLGLLAGDIPVLIKYIKSEYPDMPIIILCSYDKSDFILNLADSGAETFFELPVDFDALIRRIKLLVN